MSKAKNFETPELSVEELSHALYEVNLKLQEANSRLKEQEQRRLTFYANISHDLRAPMTAISNSVEYLLASPDLSPDELTSTLELMQKRTAYMQRLINDIFLLSSLESSDQKVHKEPVDMCFLLADYYYQLEADSRFSKAQLHLDIPDDMEVTLNADPVLMQRVLENLCTNALKYSNGTPEITLGAFLENDSLCIYVADHGIGIAPEHLSRIFDRSYMVSASRTPGAESGSGFGLSIVRTIVEHHSGTISCTSELGKGSRFTIRLPL